MQTHGRYPLWERKESYFKFRELYLEKYNEDFPKTTFNLDDHGSKIWPQKECSMCYHRNEPKKRDFCVPDFSFCHWPSCKVENSIETFEKIKEQGENEPEFNKVVWYGNIKIRRPQSPERKTRPMLVNYFGKKYPDRFDFQSGGIRGEKYISMPEMAKYECLLDIGGAGYSGRLKFLLFSNRPILLVDRLYLEYFNDDLVPYEHYIPVKMDLSDLIEKHDWILKNQQKAKEIAKKAKQFAIENFNIDKILDRFKFVFSKIGNTLDMI